LIDYVISFGNFKKRSWQGGGHNHHHHKELALLIGGPIQAIGKPKYKKNDVKI
jgi:hypothetical protein